MKLTDYLKANNIKQEQMAYELGTSQGVCSMWATGERLPRPESMKKIAEWSHGEVMPNDFYGVTTEQEQGA